MPRLLLGGLPAVVKLPDAVWAAGKALSYDASTWYRVPAMRADSANVAPESPSATTMPLGSGTQSSLPVRWRRKTSVPFGAVTDTLTWASFSVIDASSASTLFTPGGSVVNVALWTPPESKSASIVASTS